MASTRRPGGVPQHGDPIARAKAAHGIVGATFGTDPPTGIAAATPKAAAAVAATPAKKKRS